MYWLHIILTIIAVFAIIRIYFITTESFQVQDNSGITIDTSKVDMNKLSQELNTIIPSISSTVDSRPLTDASRTCDTIRAQITTLESAKEQYRAAGDWNTIRISNQTIETLKEQLTTLGCQNNNSQNN